jgi:hypothetical protein
MLSFGLFSVLNAMSNVITEGMNQNSNYFPQLTVNSQNIGGEYIFQEL